MPTEPDLDYGEFRGHGDLPLRSKTQPPAATPAPPPPLQPELPQVSRIGPELDRLMAARGVTDPVLWGFICEGNFVSFADMRELDPMIVANLLQRGSMGKNPKPPKVPDAVPVGSLLAAASLPAPEQAAPEQDPRIIKAAALAEEPKPETVSCLSCNKSFQTVPLYIGTRRMSQDYQCPECQAKVAAMAQENAARAADMQREKDAEKFRAQREREWTEMKLPYSDFDRGELRTQALAVLPEVLAWTPCNKGIGIVGSTGLGKSYLMMALMKRLYLNYSLNVRYLSMSNFGTTIGAMFKRDNDAAAEWLEALCNEPVLYLDDLGKEMRTDRSVTSLFEILKTRAEKNLPTFWTCNYSGGWLAWKYELVNDKNAMPPPAGYRWNHNRYPHIGDAILRRLVEPKRTNIIRLHS